MAHYDRNFGPGYSPAPRFGWLLVALLLVLGMLSWRLFDFSHLKLRDQEAAPRAVTPRGDLAADEKSTIELFHTASPSVVHITTMMVRRNAFSFNVTEIPRGTGSGFVWSDDG